MHIHNFVSEIRITSAIYETWKSYTLKLIFIWINNLWCCHEMVLINNTQQWWSDYPPVCCDVPLSVYSQCINCWKWCVIYLSLKRLTFLAILMSCDTRKRSVCGWQYIYIYIYVGIQTHRNTLVNSHTHTHTHTHTCTKPLPRSKVVLDN